MRARGARGAALGTLLAAAAACGACSPLQHSLPQSHKLGLVLRDASGLEPRVLERDVSARHCPPRRQESGDIGEAVEQAISSVPGATLLLDVRVTTSPESTRNLAPGVWTGFTTPPQCILVTGHAATFE